MEEPEDPEDSTSGASMHDAESAFMPPVCRRVGLLLHASNTNGTIESGARGFETTRIENGEEGRTESGPSCKISFERQGTLLNKPEERQSDAVLIIVLLD